MTSPYVAFRLWEVAPGPRLRSAHGGRIWELPGWTKAECTVGQHRAPDQRCTCGLYGYLDIESTHVGSGVQVLGATLAAGRVQEHELMVRAEYMKPIAFCLPAITEKPRAVLGLLVLKADLEASQRAAADANENVRRLAEGYGCPVFDDDEDLMLLVREWQVV